MPTAVGPQHPDQGQAEGYGLVGFRVQYDVFPEHTACEEGDQYDRSDADDLDHRGEIAEECGPGNAPDIDEGDDGERNEADPQLRLVRPAGHQAEIPGECQAQ